MASLRKLEKEVEALKKRNERVETDKGWETSFSRRVLLILFTYIAIGIYLEAIAVKDAWVHAIVPAVAFMLSTLSLPFFKRVWIKYKTKEYDD
ncbi:hypothetical protein KJ765_05685 [Candidatus Micrarchaeota archaeon]|nr:hypothetical protein [Candidatus Micrarchaeota archaeon]